MDKVFFKFIVFTTLPLVSISQIKLDSGLIGYFPISGNSLDYSGLGNHGSPIGANLSTDRNGVSGEAYFFDGIDDWISIINYSQMSPTTGASICAWIQTNNANALPWIYDRIETNDGFGLRLS